MKNKKYGIKRPYALPTDVASSTECTGLTQFVPEDGEQSESIKDIYDIPMNDIKQTADAKDGYNKKENQKN